jgi:hypothetical protein
VQIHAVVLPAGERAPGVPEDTAQVPLEMRVKGFCQTEGRVGEEVVVLTNAGREVRGTLISIEPGYEHGFGQPVPELLAVAAELRSRYRKGHRHA